MPGKIKFTGININNTVTDGAWCWFSDPRAITVNGTAVFSYLDSSASGSIKIASSDADKFTLHAGLEGDDHNIPSLLVRNSDSRIVAHYSRHNTDAHYYQRISANPNDWTSWGAETDIGPQLASTANTYSNLVEIDDGIFNFMRAVSDAGTYTAHFTKSLDDCASWSPVQKLLDEPNQRSYFKVAKTGSNRVDIICNDGHPDEYAPGNSTYHLYYDAGVWRNSAGVDLGAPPFRPKDVLTRIYDGTVLTGNGKSWVWDISSDGAGNPVIVFARIVTNQTDHRYHYARWYDGEWHVTEICTAGGTIYPTSQNGQPSYSGGVVIDPDNANVIYCSRETGSTGSDRWNGGTFQIWKGVTYDRGATFEMTQLTSAPAAHCFRPYKPKGSNELLYFTTAGVGGFYSTFVYFATRIGRMIL
jgi:hypothetical protein